MKCIVDVVAYCISDVNKSLLCMSQNLLFAGSSVKRGEEVVEDCVI